MHVVLCNGCKMVVVEVVVHVNFYRVESEGVRSPIITSLFSVSAYDRQPVSLAWLNLWMIVDQSH